MSNPGEFQPWPKIPRIRQMVITEKIDGTNAAIGFTEDGEIWCQSRKRLITPGDDNFGFARWAYDRKVELMTVLGPGLHFGEWWGSGIQRGYGLTKGEKRFSLFNTKRFSWLNVPSLTPDGFQDVEVPDGLACVPVLRVEEIDTAVINDTLAWLLGMGSIAAPGFMDPEGIVVFLPDLNAMVKKTERDEPKGEAA